jgi:hypothetical protein
MKKAITGGKIGKKEEPVINWLVAMGTYLGFLLLIVVSNNFNIKWIGINSNIY